MWHSAWNSITYILGICQWFVINMCGISILSLTDLLYGIFIYFVTVDFALNVSLKQGVIHVAIKGQNKAKSYTLRV